MSRAEVIEALFADWRAGRLVPIVSRFAPDAVWHFSAATKPPAIGHDAIGGFLRAYGAVSAVSRLRLLRQAWAGDTLFFEAVEDFDTPEGRHVVTPYCGVVTFRGELIIDWRDYFDRALIDSQITGDGALASYALCLTRLPSHS